MAEKSQASSAAAAAAVAGAGAATGVSLSQTQGQQLRKKKKVKPAVTEMISGEAVQSSNQTMWLVKLPAFVADEWAKMSDNEVLGSMKITMAPGTAGKKINIKLNVNEKKKEKKMATVGGAAGGISDDDGVADEPIPDEFTLDDVPGAPKMFSFSGDDDTERFVMQGQISKNLLLKPKGTKEYQEYLWSRNVKTTARREAIKTSDDKAAFAVSRTDTIVDFLPPAAALQKRKAKEISQGAKRGGADAAAEIKNIRAKLFEYLSKIERTTLGDLQAYCSDVEGYTNARLKELMDDYCRYNPKGPYKHLYELKPEFKDNLKKSETEEGK
jgi:hypothetical protein